jgi:hypothetical protein
MNKRQFKYSCFHNIDGGLLFAGDNFGCLHYFDLNNLKNIKDGINLPAIDFLVAKNSSIHHIALPRDYHHHNLMALSLGLGGGVALFDIKMGEKVL